MPDREGSIAFFGTYRPPVPLDIFSRSANPQPLSGEDELLITDGEAYNQNGQAIPVGAVSELFTFLVNNKPELVSDCGTGRPTEGVLFVSERENGLETLHVALRFGADKAKVKVLPLADVYGADTFGGGARMEDSGCIAGGFQVRGRTVGYSLVYVSTKEPAKDRRTPWTAVYRTSLADGKTERLTPPGQYDLNPAVSKSRDMVAVANFRFNEWTGEIEHLKTDIVVMNVDRKAQGGLGRRLLIKDAGWPTWGSDSVLFFHRGFDTTLPGGMTETKWRVFRYDITTGALDQVTPSEGCFKAVTPAAIDGSKVAVSTIREPSDFGTESRVDAQYRHIEIFDMAALDNPVQITRTGRPKADHYSPFVLDGGSRIGYHRCRTDKLLKTEDDDDEDEGEEEDEGKCEITGSVAKKFDMVQPPESHTGVGLVRVSGVFPTVSKDGKKLAFVDNDFKKVWLADENGLRTVHTVSEKLTIFSTSWNQKLDILYVCQGPAFSVDSMVDIYKLVNVSGPEEYIEAECITVPGFNNAFPSSSPNGTRLVFRSTRDRLFKEDKNSTPKENEDARKKQRKLKNLFIMDAIEGEYCEAEANKAKQLTGGECTDTHCSWSPAEGSGWIVFSSTRDKPQAGAPATDQGLDPGYFAVYLVNADDLQGDKLPQPVRVVRSSPTIAGHINHPMFSPNMRSLVFAADLAAVSADPISMPLFVHSVRPYGDIFAVDLRHTEDIAKNKDIQEFHRITHSRYEYSTPTWANLADGSVDPNAMWKLINNSTAIPAQPTCPYAYAKKEEPRQMTGHLILAKRCC